MTKDLEGNRLAQSADADIDARVRVKVSEYLARTGMDQNTFGRRVGYAGETLRKFMAGRYAYVARSTAPLRNAMQAYMEQHPVAPPTRVHGELYETANIRAIRETFQRLLPKPVAYMLYAPPGSQKTFGLEHEVARLNVEELHKNGHGRRAFYVYCRQGIRPRDMMRRICIACGSATHNEIDQMLMNLRYDYSHRRVLLILDEAQHLSEECFETLRELLDQSPHFSLLFSGSHKLPAIFDDFSQKFEQWNSRIIAKVRLPGLQIEEARAIVRREIGPILEASKKRDTTAFIDSLVKSATVVDAYADNATYINVRTLTNALDQIKAQAQAQKNDSESLQEAIA